MQLNCTEVFTFLLEISEKLFVFFLYLFVELNDVQAVKFFKSGLRIYKVKVKF